ncbi:S8/S53 family peptidase [Planobispora siamensis]|uniref:Protease n=1 Tax=Planobispora siamensis TaxID=936338 RepID=A0A8J3SEL7_9ACTN|nr:S8/S53 family peptidase [Planobispora siamensis]GIH93206.1 protease [Planobispora siamensis]
MEPNRPLEPNGPAVPDRFEEQFEVIRRAAGFPVAAGPGGAPQYLYEKGHILTRNEDAEDVMQVVREAFGPTRGEGVRRASTGERSGVSRIQVGDPESGDLWSDPNVTDALSAVRPMERERRRQMATRNHLVTITVNCCPGDEPVPSLGPLNPRPVAQAQQVADPVRILVIDTGLVDGFRNYPQLQNVDGEQNDPEFDLDGKTKILREYVGHGTFIAGLIAAVAPHARVKVLNSLSDAGSIPEEELGDRLVAAVAQEWPHIISLSAGTPASFTETLLGLERFMNQLRTQETLLVAAAGNNGSEELFWPAAHASQQEYRDAVVSVGALRTDGRQGACFTNHGPWVKVYAPGERLVSTFSAPGAPPEIYDYQHSTYPRCRYHSTYLCTCQYPKHVGELTEKTTFSSGNPNRVEFTEGLAEWSGTSFATPLVAAMIANRMRENDALPPREAAKALLEKARTDMESLPESRRTSVRGRSVPVLLPPGWVGSPVQTPSP